MPYVIKTTQRGYYCMHCGMPGTCPDDEHARITRRAVATLEEARAIVSDATTLTHPRIEQPYTLTESGGTVGPLPDGTVIEVEYVSYADLNKVVHAMPGGYMSSDTHPTAIQGQRVLDTYNARES